MSNRRAPITRIRQVGRRARTGTLDATQLDHYRRGDGDIGNGDHNVLVHALNEVFHARGPNHSLALPPPLI